jgi:hypothetical protein
MSTLSHPAPSTPRKRFPYKVSRPAARPAADQPELQNQSPTTYTRNALPVALAWFLVPVLVLLLLQTFGWK